jgi:hypothetical protein
MFELLVGIGIGCLGLFIFARLNKRKFIRYMSTDLDILMNNTRDEINKAKDSEAVEKIIAMFKEKLAKILK